MWRPAARDEVFGAKSSSSQWLVSTSSGQEAVPCSRDFAFGEKASALAPICASGGWDLGPLTAVPSRVRADGTIHHHELPIDRQPLGDRGLNALPRSTRARTSSAVLVGTCRTRQGPRA